MKLKIRFLYLGQIFLLVSAIVFFTNETYAQTDIQMSQHMFNRINYNPSATGASRYVNANLLARKQWVGWTGSPETSVLNIHSYVPKIRSGLGFSAIFDRLGIEQKLNFKASYAFHAKLSDKLYLSMGLAAGVHYRRVDWGRQNPSQPDQISVNWDAKSYLRPDFDCGLELHHEKFAFGLSSTHFTSNTLNNNLFSGRHFFGYFRYTVPISFDWELQPAVFSQHSILTTHVELNCLAFYQKKFWFGAGYRGERFVRPEAIVGYVGCWITESWSLSYSYDFSIGKIYKLNSGSHEICLALRLKKAPSLSAKTPRFFE